ncbi:MAG: abortive infection family protein [Actinobacteria bacterium]|nr:abortive infection family protein [Actinomycetota bacterium]
MTPVNALRVHGDPGRFAARLRTRRRSGEALLSRAEALMERHEDAVDEPPSRRGLAGLGEQAGLQMGADELRDAFQHWVRTNRGVLAEFLGRQAEDYPMVNELPTEELLATWQHRAHVRQTQDRIRANLAVLDGLLERLGRATTASLTRTETQFLELRESGLIESDALAAYVKRINRITRTADIADSLAASKELLEAVYCGTCEVLGEHWDQEDEFQKLGRRARTALLNREVSSGAVNEQLRMNINIILGGLASIDQGLASLRNYAGTGHGRTRLNKEVMQRHALFAADLVEALSRYVLLSLRALGFI